MTTPISFRKNLSPSKLKWFLGGGGLMIIVGISLYFAVGSDFYKGDLTGPGVNRLCLNAWSGNKLIACNEKLPTTQSKEKVKVQCLQTTDTTLYQESIPVDTNSQALKGTEFCQAQGEERGQAGFCLRVLGGGINSEIHNMDSIHNNYLCHEAMASIPNATVACLFSNNNARYSYEFQSAKGAMAVPHGVISPTTGKIDCDESSNMENVNLFYSDNKDPSALKNTRDQNYLADEPLEYLPLGTEVQGVCLNKRNWESNDQTNTYTFSVLNTTPSVKTGIEACQQGLGTLARELKGDFDGDQNEDRLLIYNNPANWRVFNNQYQVIPPVWMPEGWSAGAKNVIGDFNGDNRDDVIVMFKDGSGVWYWYLALAAKNYQFEKHTHALVGVDPGTEIIVADYTHDNIDDFKIKTTAGEQCFSLNNGSYKFENCRTEPSYGTLRKELSGDFDGNGAIDKLQIYITPFSWRVALNGSTISTLWLDWGTGKEFIGDFNGDAKDDVITVFKDKNNIWHWYLALSTGINFTGIKDALTNVSLASDALVFDVDRDGILEIRNGQQYIDYNFNTNRLEVVAL
jgi:hypothetical protein